MDSFQNQVRTETGFDITNTLHFREKMVAVKEFPVYRGISRQCGYALGSIFRTAMRTVIPILKPIAKAGLESMKEQGISAIRDTPSGQNIKQVLKRRQGGCKIHFDPVGGEGYKKAHKEKLPSY